MKNYILLLASLLITSGFAQGAKLALDDGWDTIAEEKQTVQQPDEGWYQASGEELVDTFQAFAWDTTTLKGVQHYRLYTPENFNPKAAPLAIVLVHGTFAKAHNAEFGDQDNAQGLLPKALRFTKYFADKYGAATKFVSFGWSGDENDRDRLAAGQILGDFIRTHLKGHNVITIAHSHGGNVVNHATHYLDEPITMIVHLAAPVIQGNGAPFYAPTNFVYLLNFYSTGDFVQIAGGNNFHKYIQQSVNPLQPITHMVDYLRSKLFDKSGFQPKNLPGDYTGNGKFFFAPERRILNTFAQEEHRRTGRVINIRTQANGIDPDHSFIKHCVVDHLPVILEKLNTYKMHNDLDLNIIDVFTARPEAAAFAAAESPVLLAIRSDKGAFAGKDHLAVTEEARYSNNQKERYQKLYKKDFAYKGTLRERIGLSVNNLLKVARG
jgi:hypothetical protein